MTTFDLSPLWRTTVGFDEFGGLFDTVFSNNNKNTSYPPYNIVKQDKNVYQITMAIAGFDQEHVHISQEGNLLSVKGEMGNEKNEDNFEYLYKGIANRNFEKKFELADTVKVVKADLKNGLLSIDLEREIPEHQKPRKIDINTNSKLLQA
jgi:molecular chaperone IbpA